jgi:hypothetical protein
MGVPRWAFPGSCEKEEAGDGLLQRKIERDCPEKTGSIHGLWRHPSVSDIWTFKDVWKPPILAGGCCQKKWPVELFQRSFWCGGGKVGANLEIMEDSNTFRKPACVW